MRRASVSCSSAIPSSMMASALLTSVSLILMFFCTRRSTSVRLNSLTLANFAMLGSMSRGKARSMASSGWSGSISLAFTMSPGAEVALIRMSVFSENQVPHRDFGQRSRISWPAARHYRHFGWPVSHCEPLFFRKSRMSCVSLFTPINVMRELSRSHRSLSTISMAARLCETAP